jgi:hypothetical protein
MRRDDRSRDRSPLDGPATEPVPFDVAADPNAPELVALESELARAGARARATGIAGGPSRPRTSFVADLRARLLATYPADGIERSDEPVSPGAAVVDAPHPPSPAPSAGPRVGAITSARGWAVLAVAAAIVVAVLAPAAGRLFPSSVDAEATEAVGTDLVRDGATSPLAEGQSLRVGDEIRVTPDGRAALRLGSSITRLAGGTDLRLDDLSVDRLRLELLAGRAYHRVALPAGGSYEVTTGPVTFTAAGTAFDLERGPTGDGRERVRLLGLQHAVGVAGPDLRLTVGEGRLATVVVGAEAPPALAVGSIDPVTLADPWLIDNARQDRALGLPLGVLDGIALGPTPSPSELGPPEMPGTVSPGPLTPSPTATPRPTPRPATRPAATPTPRPTPEPTPKPTPVPSLSLGTLSCPGGVIVDWGAYGGAGFRRYATVRATGGSIPKAYPPRDGATYLDGSSTRDRSATSTYDATGASGTTYYYRTMALDRADRVLAASPVRAATAKTVGELGELVVGPGDGGTTAFSWTPYAGPADCFSYYKLVFSASDPTPSYFEGAQVLGFSSDRGLAGASYPVEQGTYHFRLQVIRTTALGTPPKFLVAQSAVATYTVP